MLEVGKYVGHGLNGLQVNAQLPRLSVSFLLNFLFVK